LFHAPKDYPKNPAASAAKRTIAFFGTNTLAETTYVEFRNTLQRDSILQPRVAELARLPWV
jgi:hypothetical protein